MLFAVAGRGLASWENSAAAHMFEDRHHMYLLVSVRVAGHTLLTAVVASTS